MKHAVAGLLLMIALVPTSATAGLAQYGLLDPEDGLVTRDNSTGLEWLDLTATQNRSYQDVLGGFGGYTTTHGFRVASKGEVQQLFQGVGIWNQYAAIPEYVPGATELFLFLGVLKEYNDSVSRTSYQTHGMRLPEQACCPSSPAVSTFYLIYEHLTPVAGRAYLENGGTNFESAFDYRGTFLVRSSSSAFGPSANQPSVLEPPSGAIAWVPEPGTLALVALGLAGLGYSRSKKYPVAASQHLSDPASAHPEARRPVWP